MVIFASRCHLYIYCSAEQPSNMESQSDCSGSGVYTLSLAGKSSEVCKLEFCPKEVLIPCTFFNSDPYVHKYVCI